MKILILNGPNLNLLGRREPEIYGSATYTDLLATITAAATRLAVTVECRQSNHEGELIDWIQTTTADAIIINPAAYTHTSIAILDALKAINLPTVEVHLSAIETREDFRRFSYTALACCKSITGKGFSGYVEALEFLVAGQ